MVVVRRDWAAVQEEEGEAGRRCSPTTICSRGAFCGEDADRNKSVTCSVRKARVRRDRAEGLWRARVKKKVEWGVGYEASGMCGGWSR